MFDTFKNLRPTLASPDIEIPSLSLGLTGKTYADQMANNSVLSLIPSYYGNAPSEKRVSL
jgi:hypothetical protein